MLVKVHVQAVRYVQSRQDHACWSGEGRTHPVNVNTLLCGELDLGERRGSVSVRPSLFFALARHWRARYAAPLLNKPDKVGSLDMKFMQFRMSTRYSYTCFWTWVDQPSPSPKRRWELLLLLQAGKEKEETPTQACLGLLDISFTKQVTKEIGFIDHRAAGSSHIQEVFDSRFADGLPDIKINKLKIQLWYAYAFWSDKPTDFFYIENRSKIEYNERRCIE